VQTKLSQAALETLAIIAYNQPLTRVESENIRCVNSDRAVQTLVARSLIEEKGKKDSIGKPILSKKTIKYLTFICLQKIKDKQTKQKMYNKINIKISIKCRLNSNEIKNNYYI